MDLKRLIESKQNNKNSGSNVNATLETLRTNTRAQNPESGSKTKKYIKPLKYSVISIASLFLAIVLFLYIPQIFISDGQNDGIFDNWNYEALTERQRYISDNPYEDFDGDDVANYRELEQNTNPYLKDTDFDGISDMFDKEPNKFNEAIYDALVSQGHSLESAFEMNNVIMWADSKECFIKGGVIKTLSGAYRFNNFRGWAQFPDEGTAYKYENGVHTKLEHRSIENAWYIDADCDVYMITEEPELVYKYEFFGKTDYLYGAWGRFVNAILPQKGFITCSEMWLSDTFVSIQKTITTQKRTFSETKLIPARFARNSNTLLDLMTVYKFINEDEAVLASIIDEERGEILVQIYGYNADGDLLISSLDGKTSGKLKIHPISAKTLDENNNIISREWFEFDGCGFDSKLGQTINFFATSSENEATEDEAPGQSDDMSEDEEVSADTSDPEVSEEEKDEADSVILNPLNGSQVIDGETFYFIGGKKVTNTYLRLNDNGKYEIVGPPATGAFYVNQDGVKLTGLYKNNDKYYIYDETGFIKNQFVRIENGNYEISRPGNKNVYFFGEGCTPVTGWFTFNKNKYYADKEFKVLYNCFVRNENGQYRYLDYNGHICTNKLITVDGIEIMLDDSGNIINYQEVKNIVNKYLRS